MTKACVILTTTESEDEARRIARALVEARLAACVQRLTIGSVYEWSGAVEDTPEILLLIKTSVDRYPEVESWILENHSYQVPEVLMIRAAGGSSAYLDWVARATGGPTIETGPGR